MLVIWAVTFCIAFLPICWLCMASIRVNRPKALSGATGLADSFNKGSCCESFSLEAWKCFFRAAFSLVSMGRWKGSGVRKPANAAGGPQA